MKLFGRDFRFITIIGWLLSILSLIYGALIGVWIILLKYGENAIRGDFSNYDSELGRQLMFAIVPFGLPFLLLVVCVWLLWLCRKRGWDGNGRWRTALLVLLVAILGVMSIDSAPIKNDYTTLDILTQGRDAKVSYQTLMKYFKKGDSLKIVSPYELCKSDFGTDTNVTAYSEIIEKTWNDSSYSRTVIDKLATYDVVADLIPGVPVGTNIPIVSFVAFRNLSQIYQSHSLLKTENGESVEAARELAEFHSLALKTHQNSSLFMTKMIFSSLMRQDMETAYRIVQNPKCAPEAVRILANAFPPVPDKDVSLRSPMIALYLHLKNICETVPSEEYLELYRPPQDNPSFLHRNILPILVSLTFKRNTTIHIIKRCLEPVIAGASQRPMKMPDTEAFIREHFLRPKLNNLAGWYFVRNCLNSYSRAADAASRTKVLSNLLAIELHKRLGEPIDIPDFYSGKPYFVDAKTGKLTSVGPDGIAGTKDDIQLGQSF